MTETMFATLHAMLRAHAAELIVSTETSERYVLDAPVGPATLAAWGGRVRRPTIPVAWIERHSAYVGMHLMGLDGKMSPALRKRLSGKTCLHIHPGDGALIDELGIVVAESIARMRRGGFIADIAACPPRP